MSTSSSSNTASDGSVDASSGEPAPGTSAVDDDAIESTIFRLLDARAANATICPSDVARSLKTSEDAWRALMPGVRAVAAGLATQGKVEVTRKGVEVDANSPGGPIRIGKPRSRSRP